MGLHALLQGIFLSQGSNLHLQADSLPLSRQGSRVIFGNKPKNTRPLPGGEIGLGKSAAAPGPRYVKSGYSVRDDS